MGTALKLFDNMPELPAEIAEELDQISNLVPIEKVNSLGIKGKVFSITLDGNTQKLMKKTEDGDDEPRSMLKVVVMGYAQSRGRAYYEGTYDDSKPQMPLCWSEDGKAPSEHVAKPQCKSCDKCELSAKGSKVSDNGKEMSACQQFRMLAVKPYTAGLDFKNLRLKLSITSDWDGQRDNKGGDPWYGFRNYVDMLKAHGIKHTASVVTKIKFDSETAYPKLLFSADSALKGDQIGQILPEVRGDEVRDLISKSWTPNGVDGHRVEETEQTEVETPAPKEKIKPKPAEDDGEIEMPPATTTTTKKETEKPKEPPKEAAKPKETAKDRKKEPEQQKAPPEAKEVQSDLSSILNDWT